ncbi:hypothetical protein M405DRAFT_57013 [Rhizopogon salebrosus TDB-379]|nr:hypothetical protein M405DRAFT_57013 [Rhizopogon salebrosus TDB-379]
MRRFLFTLYTVLGWYVSQCPLPCQIGFELGLRLGCNHDVFVCGKIKNTPQFFSLLRTSDCAPSYNSFSTSSIDCDTCICASPIGLHDPSPCLNTVARSE